MNTNTIRNILYLTYPIWGTFLFVLLSLFTSDGIIVLGMITLIFSIIPITELRVSIFLKMVLIFVYIIVTIIIVFFWGWMSMCIVYPRCY